ncbi:MAG: (2Fe-2S)-binding protein [Myxococcota bacterium]
MSRILCQCLNVSEGEIKRAIRAGADTVEAVSERCEAGSGCGSCRGGIEVLLEEAKRRRTRKPVPQALLDQLGLFGGGNES